MEGIAEQLLDIQTFIESTPISNIGTTAMACLMNLLVDEIRQQIIRNHEAKENRHDK